jgi:hypothetical protein
MRRYTVKALTIQGSRNRLFRCGETITEAQLQPNHADSLVRGGYIERIAAERKVGNRIVIGTMIWKRPEVFRFWAACVDNLREHFPELEIIACAVGSDGEESRELAESCGVHYREFPNQPLREKADARLRFCKTFKPDWILFLGSDDVICPDLLREYVRLMEDGADIIEVSDLYYFDTATGQTAYSSGYTHRRHGEPLAVARCINAAVAEELDWSLWRSQGRSSLDGAIHRRLSQSDFRRDRVTVKDSYLVLDIKTEVNISPANFDRPNITPAENGYIEQRLGRHLFSRLEQLGR